MKKRQIIILFIIPSLLALTAILLHYAHGPYWIGYNFDPDYLYLINSLALSESKQTLTTGNPGTTLQMLGAMIMHIVHFLDYSSSGNLENSVLSKPENYLLIINIVLISFITMMLFIIGYVAFSLTNNILFSLILQLSPFLSNGMLTQGYLHVSPESLLLFSSILFMTIMIKIIYCKNDCQLPALNLYYIALPIVCGFGMATKLTFAPFILIPLFVLPDLKNKILFLILTLLSFVFWTYPIIPQYGNLLNWYYKIITHKGYYGLGSSGWVDIDTYFRNLFYLLSADPLCFLIILFSAGFIAKTIWFSAKRRRAWQDVSFRILLAVVVAQLFGILICAKHPSDRYLIPVFSLSGFTLFLILLFSRRMNYSNFFNAGKWMLCLLPILILVGGWRMYDLKNIFNQKNQIKKESIIVNNLLEKDFKNCVKISYNIPSLGASSSPAVALGFANFFIARGIYSDLLQKIYGDAYFYNILNGKLYSWTEELSVREIMERGYGKGIIFYGPPTHYFGNKLICLDRVSKKGIRELSIENTVFNADNKMLLQCSPLNGLVDKTACGSYKIFYLNDVIGGEYQTIYVVSKIKEGS